ncbi:MAG TPA: hypothetical protein VEK82_16470 [Stellaceae bacterium]|nr:hypothetical protein [Stellaceae bacterium]
MLLRILHQTAARAFKAGTALLLTQLRISLLRPLDLRNTQNRRPGRRPRARHIRNTASLSNDPPFNSKSRTAVRLRGNDV